jgi:hypothetical protein
MKSLPGTAFPGGIQMASILRVNLIKKLYLSTLLHTFQDPKYISSLYGQDRLYIKYYGFGTALLELQFKFGVITWGYLGLLLKYKINI